MERPTCKTCPYWEDYGAAEITLSRCVRYAPRAIVGDNENWSTYFPEMGANDGCGEHPDFPAYLASLKRGSGPTPEMTLGEALNDPTLAKFAHPRMTNALKDGPEAVRFYNTPIMRIHAHELRVVRNFGPMRQEDFSRWQRSIANLRTSHPDIS